MKPLLLIPMLALSAQLVWAGAPYKPTSGSQVLEKLRTTPLDSAQRELREQARQLSQEPTNLVLAVTVATGFIERARVEGDPRYRGYATHALQPWWDADDRPSSVSLLRASLLQSDHHFPEALQELDRLIASNPRHGGAQLMRANILTVTGRYAEAQRAAIRLIGQVPGHLALGATALVASLTGRSETASTLLTTEMKRLPADTSTSDRVWLMTLLAEIENRRGKTVEAETNFKQAIALGTKDVYLLAAYADFLLDQKRPTEVIPLLEDQTRVDPLLLRYAIAQAAIDRQSATAKAAIEQLHARFEAAHLRGDSAHQREEGLFALHLQHDADAALKLAKANWEVQKEPTDARLFLQAAHAAQQPQAATPVLEWMQTNKIEDVHLNSASQAVAALGSPSGAK